MAALADGALDAPLEPSAAPTAPAPAREDHIAERRRSLLDATISVIGRDGLTGLTMKAVAKAAGCSYGVAAFHFHSKDRLILAAYEQMIDDYERVRTVRAAPAADSAGRAIQRLRAMVDSDFDESVTSARQMSVFVSFWAESVRNPAYRRICAEVKARYQASAAEDIAALAIALGRTVDAEQASATLNAISDGYWIANIVGSNSGITGCEAGRNACLAYLDMLFPGHFPETPAPSPSSPSMGLPE